MKEMNGNNIKKAGVLLMVFQEDNLNTLIQYISLQRPVPFQEVFGL